LKKEIFSFSLGGMTDSSLLTGKEEEIGLLTNALLKNNSVNSLFLFDEIDKASIRVQDSLINVLDNAQNTRVFNHYLGVNLDFSPIVFVVTANDRKKISDSLFSRMTIIELSDYTVEQKKEIAQKIIQK
jgi:ATP-dependent Lon protease